MQKIKTSAGKISIIIFIDGTKSRLSVSLSLFLSLWPQKRVKELSECLSVTSLAIDRYITKWMPFVRVHVNEFHNTCSSHNNINYRCQ